MDLNSRGADSTVNLVAVGQVFVLLLAVLFNNSSCHLLLSCCKSLPELFC